ncbi:ankyrin repeat domain-containing protein [Roseateles oligotrophus]|uniref:Ankyrin repeat domain-containing protein n=1 Tax=Roseateles oligotrophus TaxID=1769250 RepID=A0ABT2YJY2_9BURK|nr:ankyrin repeat domain-containing protein [Roseateles oligotrophus]MCV2370276.1 ankyrin repeat domain-containing protein [Roseateles oligotrophus]
MKTNHHGAAAQPDLSALPALPNHADLQQLKRQARELLRAWRAGDDSPSLERAAPYRQGDAAAPPSLSLAQLVIARELGFPSWPALHRAVMAQQEARQLDNAALVTRSLALALGRGWDSPQPERALALMQRLRGPCPPGLRAALALVRGELETLEAVPAAGQRLPPFDAPALAYVCFSSLHRLGEPWAGGLMRSARALLEDCAQGGSDLDALRMPDPDQEPAPGATEPPGLPLLYGAIAQAQSPELAAALLAAGANPNDGESLYHACEDADRSRAALQIRQLIAHGARWQGTNALLRLLDFEDPAGLALALSLGADVNEAGPEGATALHHALRRGRRAACLSQLIAQGADLSARDAEGRNPATLAALLGELEALELLAAQGAWPELPSARERFLAACAAADEPTALALVNEQPELMTQLDAQALRLLPDQAQRRAKASVALMLSLGWPVAVQGDWQASALNQAAFNGDATLVRLLLAHGASWEERNGFGGDVMGSLQHAAVHLPQAGGDYLGALQALLAAGAPWPSEEAREELPETMQAWLDEQGLL